MDPQGLSVNARGICFGGSGANVDLGGGTLPFVSGVDAYLARFSEQPVPAGITSITDVPGDQGRQVSIQFSPSGADDAPGGTAITRYELFRKRDALADKSPAAGAAPGAIALQDRVDAGTVSASGQDGYVTAAPTLVDSTVAQGQHYSTFFVRAATANPLTYFDSPPACRRLFSPHVAPPAPTGFAFQNSALSWDLCLWRRTSTTSRFTVRALSAFGSATIVDYTTGASMDVTASPYAYYFVTATDFSGNEGQPAALATPTAVDGSPKYFALSISAYPNPFNPQTTIRYTVPARGRVAINLFDARGSHVATLFDGVREIGAFTLGWNGEDNTGQRLSSGCTSHV